MMGELEFELKLELEPLLSGPLAVVAFPNVAPQYLKTVLSILAPSKPNFPAPSRKANPDYYEPSVQTGLQKLMLLGARVEGKVGCCAWSSIDASGLKNSTTRSALAKMLVCMTCILISSASVSCPFFSRWSSSFRNAMASSLRMLIHSTALTLLCWNIRIKGEDRSSDWYWRCSWVLRTSGGL